MWTTKHRPKRLDDVIGQDKIVNSIKARMPNIPHMLFKGPAGVGKTTIALAIKEELGCSFLEINASDESGIDVVRTKIKNFANTGGLDGKPKLILLDEADNTSSDFQTALRRLMEVYEKNCHFIITCNYPQKIIEPIKSRCRGGTYEFAPIEFEPFKKYILSILSKESMTIDDNALLKLYEMSNGDMRIIDKLEEISFQTKNVKLTDVVEIDYNDTYKDLLKLIQENKYTEACKFSNPKHIAPMYKYLLSSQISEEKKMKIVRYAADYEFRKHFAETEFIQIHAFIANIMSILKEEQKATIPYPLSSTPNFKISGVLKK